MNKRNGNGDKIALVLAGGGLTGAVYEIGALRAIDDLLVDRTVNDFDIYVGTSAGSFVGSMLANGISPDTMLQALDGSHPELRPVERGDLFNVSRREMLRRTIDFPGKLASAWSHYWRHTDDMNFFDALWSLLEALPSGFYDPRALGRYIAGILNRKGFGNRFDRLARDLYIIATDLDTGERVVFGRDERNDATISQAVSASTAVPLLYKPVRIGENELVDGGLRGNASLDVAIEKGATLVVCINPFVPYDNSDRQSIPFLGPDGGYLSDKGMQAIASQVSRITGHAALHYHIKQMRRAHPEVDIIVIEPRPKDYQMFFYNIMRYSTRLIVARHGFESVTLDLAEDYAVYKDTLARHGVPISRRLVIEELDEIQTSHYDPLVIRRVLERRTGRCSGQRRNTPACQLDLALTELESALDSMSAKA
jgi:NTE family protein